MPPAPCTDDAHKPTKPSAQRSPPRAARSSTVPDTSRRTVRCHRTSRPSGSPMELSLAYDADDAASARALVAEQIKAWHLAAAPVLAWFDEADAAVPTGGVADGEISYHPAGRVLSFDVWTGGHRVFGLDDAV